MSFIIKSNLESEFLQMLVSVIFLPEKMTWV